MKYLQITQFLIHKNIGWLIVELSGWVHDVVFSGMLIMLGCCFIKVFYD